MTERICTLCQKPYGKKQSESQDRFEQRSYCGIGCSRKAQRAQKYRFGSRMGPHAMPLDPGQAQK